MNVAGWRGRIRAVRAVARPAWTPVRIRVRVRAVTRIRVSAGVSRCVVVRWRA